MPTEFPLVVLLTAPAPPQETGSCIYHCVTSTLTMWDEEDEEDVSEIHDRLAGRQLMCPRRITGLKLNLDDTFSFFARSPRDAYEFVRGALNNLPLGAYLLLHECT